MLMLLPRKRVAIEHSPKVQSAYKATIIYRGELSERKTEYWEYSMLKFFQNNK